MGVGVAVAVGVAVGVRVGVAIAVAVAVGVDVGVGVAVAVAVGVAVAVAVAVGVGVNVAVGVGVGVAVGVWVAQFSLPMVINVPGELWLLYSVVTQLALRSIVETLTSSSVPAALSAFAARDMKYSELLEKLPMPEALRAPVVSV